MVLPQEKSRTQTCPTTNINTSFLEAALVVASMLSPRTIQRNGDITTVIWNDGKATVVRRAKDDPDSEYIAFCAALAKRLYGSNSAVMRTVTNADSEVQKKRYLYRKKLAQKAQQDKEKQAKERKLRRMVKHIQLMDEARNRYMETLDSKDDSKDDT